MASNSPVAIVRSGFFIEVGALWLKPRMFRAGLMTLNEVETVRVVATPTVRVIAFVATFVAVCAEVETVCKRWRCAEREVGIIVECREDQHKRN